MAGVELILHAGDVGGDDILDELAMIAPVHAVYGNTDHASDPRLAQRIRRKCEGLWVGVSHGHEVGSPTPQKLLETYSEDVLIYGHTHRPLITHVDNRLVINPGGAGARRFNLEPTVARLTIVGTDASAQIIALKS